MGPGVGSVVGRKESVGEAEGDGEGRRVSVGFKEATAIQEKAIPHIFQGTDILASAQTGTGGLY